MQLQPQRSLQNNGKIEALKAEKGYTATRTVIYVIVYEFKGGKVDLKYTIVGCLPWFPIGK